ncbi:MAG: DUF3467 domain-containing protein [Candidatus Methylomirabilales bacterium]
MDRLLERSRLEGRYANMFQIGHNAFEFLMDFGQHYPETSEMNLHTRIITSPTYAKALLELLQAAIQQYEESHGPIPSQ